MGVLARGVARLALLVTIEVDIGWWWLVAGHRGIQLPEMAFPQARGAGWCSRRAYQGRPDPVSRGRRDGCVP